MRLPTHWRQRNRVIIAIVDMDDSHLTNTMQMIARAAAKAADYIFHRDLASLSGFGSTCHGDAATMAIEQEIACLQPHSVAEVLHTWPIWHAFREEADRRAAAQGFVPIPEEVVTKAPEVSDVPSWASINPKDLPAVIIPTQRSRRPRVFGTDEDPRDKIYDDDNWKAF